MNNNLAFEENKDKRKFVCFCCGVQFSTLIDYKQHILDKHEVGREYIVCPLAHCGYPVRDLRQHFKAIHPNTPIPEIGAMRPTIWKDFNEKGKPKTRKPKFREGFYTSTKMNKQLHYRSGYESKLYEYLDADTDVIAFDVEPFEIQYSHQGHTHNYIPDLIVKFRDGHTEVIEIKPTNQTLLEKNRDKWNAAHKACQVRGWEFVVITETGLDRWRKKIQLQFASLADQPLSE